MIRISGNEAWKSFQRDAGSRVGVWVRRAERVAGRTPERASFVLRAACQTARPVPKERSKARSVLLPTPGMPVRARSQAASGRV